MAPAHKTQFQEPHAARHAWWASPLGSALIAAESQLLGEALDDVFGWELLQIGAWGSGRELLSGARTRHQAIVAPPGLSSSADIRGRPTHLPIISDSIDAVLLPHILEFATDPYAIVREADRVLVGEGRLLVLGFRPWSLWGLRERWSRSGFPPGTRRVLSERRIREWLVLLGYEVVSAQHYLFRGPWSGGLAAGEGTGRMLRRGLTYPLPANAYLLKARKRIYTLTPIRPRFRERPAVLGGLVKPSPRSRA
ncbi:MAG TPA: methyltransferase domain-containing protein [Steroidobacteraceae bacterium]|nr:methyltransferase domain-containing protein [Steroidobacteraceae bacterium]